MKEETKIKQNIINLQKIQNKNSSKNCSNLISSFQPLISKTGITLITLIITIIIMLILVVATVTVALNSNLFSIAKRVTDNTGIVTSEELELSKGTININGLMYDSIKSYVNNESGYVPYSYLESTGKQYINTKIQVTKSNCRDIRFVIDTDITDTSRWRLDGSASRAHNGIYVGTNSGYFYYGIGKDSSTGVVCPKGDNIRCLFDLDVKNNNLKITNVETGQVYVNMDTITNFNNFDDTGLPLWLFGYSGENRLHKAKIYSAKIYLNDIIVRDFIPALDKDLKPCLYDKVNKEFYYNSGTEEFLYSQ